MTESRPMFPPALSRAAEIPSENPANLPLDQTGEIFCARQTTFVPEAISASVPSAAHSARSVNNQSRRSFLMNTIVALPITAALPTTAPALPSLATGAGVAATQPFQAAEEEDPRVIELGAQIGPLQRAYRDATAREAEAYASFELLRPAVPDELVTAHEKYPFLRDCRVEMNDGRGFVQPTTFIGDDGKRYAKPAPRILDSKLLRIRIIEHDMARTNKAGRETRRLARLAMKYERAFQDALSESNFADLENERRYAAYDLEKLVWELRKLEPKTIAGVLIFARALSAFEEAEESAGKIKRDSAQLLGSELAGALLRLSTSKKAIAT